METDLHVFVGQSGNPLADRIYALSPPAFSWTYADGDPPLVLMAMASVFDSEGGTQHVAADVHIVYEN